MLHVFAALLLLPYASWAQRSHDLTVELWWEVEPMVGWEDASSEDASSEEQPASEREVVKHLLEYSRILFSAMIYGYRFTYVPADRERQLADEFSLVPVAEIPWGDRNLRALQTDVRGGRVYAKLEYQLQDYQIARRRSWSSNSIPVSPGTGRANLFEGPGEKLTAVREAIRDAIDAYARSRMLNRPRQISGELILWDGPTTWVHEGAYVSTVKVKLLQEEVIPNRVF